METVVFIVIQWEERPIENGASDLPINAEKVEYVITDIFEGHTSDLRLDFDFSG